jgi:DNA polymerase-3 subunit alpha
VRFGLAAVKNVGEGAVQTVVERRSQQPLRMFSSLAAMCDAIDWSVVNRRAIESLAKAGAMDELGSRGGILEALEGSIAAAQRRQRATARGQMDLFGAAATEVVPSVTVRNAELPSGQILEWEKELLGTYMSDHPLSEVLQSLLRTPEGRSICEIAQLETRGVGSSVRILAMVEGVRRITTKASKTMAVATFEDLSGRVEAVLFPEAFDRHGASLKVGAILDLRGRVDRRGEALQIICELVSEDLPTVAVDDEAPDIVVVRFASASNEWVDIRTMQQADEILRRHEGANSVVLEIPFAAGAVRYVKSRTRKVEWGPALELELRSVSGVMDVELLAVQEARLAS